MSLKYETVAKFSAKGRSASCGKSKRGGDVYYVKRKLDTGELSCNCKGWIYSRKCKHVDYVKTNPYIELTDIPTYKEALATDWGKNLEEKEKWTVEHLKAIEI